MSEPLSRDLKHAIDEGDVERLRDLLSGHPELAATPISWGPVSPQCTTEPLHYLSDGPFNQLWEHGRQAELAKVLLEAGAPVDGLPTSGETPLHGAASLGALDVADVLIDHGANLEAVARYPDIPDGTPLDFAVHFGMVDVVDLLVARGARVLSARMAAGAGQLERIAGELTSLRRRQDRFLDVCRCATVCDRTSLVEYLLANGLDVNATIDGATLLHWAAWEAKPRMVTLLLTRGADPARRDAEHEATAYRWAAHRGRQLGPRWGHPEVMRVLESAEGRPEPR